LLSLVRNRVVLAVYLLFSVACFFTVHGHSKEGCYTSEHLNLPITPTYERYFLE